MRAIKKKSEQSCKVEHTRAALQGSADGKISNHLEEQTKASLAYSAINNEVLHSTGGTGSIDWPDQTKPNQTKLHQTCHQQSITCKDGLGRKTDKLLLTGGKTGAHSAVSLAQR